MGVQGEGSYQAQKPHSAGARIAAGALGCDTLATGPQAGKLGVLIGETDNLRQRIKQYVAGTQERGNRLWRETFLSKGDARLFVLDLKGLSVKSAGNARPLAATELLQSNNRRLVLEQLLVMEAVSRVDDSIWIVNARQ